MILPRTKQKERDIPTSRQRPPVAAKLLDLVITSLDDDKAQDIVVIDLAGKSSMADHMVICTGTSQRHIGAMAEHLREQLKSTGGKVAIEGLPQGDWVLIDGGDVIVHMFRPEVRTFYNLEKMWSPMGGEKPRLVARRTQGGVGGSDAPEAFA